MRVLLEFKNKRVDIKTPISMRDKQEEMAMDLISMIHEALRACKIPVDDYSSSAKALERQKETK